MKSSPGSVAGVSGSFSASAAAGQLAAADTASSLRKQRLMQQWEQQQFHTNMLWQRLEQPDGPRVAVIVGGPGTGETPNPSLA